MNENYKNFYSATSNVPNVRWFRQQLTTTESATEESTVASSMYERDNSGNEHVRNGSVNGSGGTQMANRTVANPFGMQTHIGKITFSSSPPTKRPPPTYLTAELFHHKRQDRKNDIEEIQSDMGNIAIGASADLTTPRAGVVILKAIDMKLPKESEADFTYPSHIRRSKTDGNLKVQRSLTARAGSSLDLDTLRGESPSEKTNHSDVFKSQENLPSGTITSNTKRRSYDPTEVRRYMKEQRMKRKTTKKETTEQKLANEKEQIKKRLEELRESSKAIIKKNIEKIRANISNQTKQPVTEVKSSEKLSDKKSATKIEKGEVVTGLTEGGDKEEHVAAEVEPTISTNNAEEKVEESEGASSRVEIEVFKSQSSREQRSAQKSPKSKRRLLSAKKQRVALSGDDSSAGIKGNQSKPKDDSFSQMNETSSKKRNDASKIVTPVLNVQSSKLLENQQKSEIKLARACDADEPSASNTFKSKEYITQNVAPNKSKETTELPFWLQTSSVQIYPFNFIHAVRHKIECIVESSTNEVTEVSDVVLDKRLTTSENIAEDGATLEPIETPEVIPVSFAPPIHLKGSTGSRKRSSRKVSPKSSLESLEGNLNKSLPTPDFDSSFYTNISSISKPWKTMSEVSSLKSESVHSIDLKKHSKKKKVSISLDDDKQRYTQAISKDLKDEDESQMFKPLSLERFEQLEITSGRRSKDDTAKATVEELEICQSIDDFSKLLADIDNGIHQIIASYELLRSTLGSSQDDLHRDDIENSGQHIHEPTQEEHTTDFEDTVHGESVKASSSLQCIELSSHKKDCKDENGTNEHLFPNVPELNFDSVTPTSVRSSESGNRVIMKSGSMEELSSHIKTLSSNGKTFSVTSGGYRISDSAHSENSISDSLSKRSEAETTTSPS